MLKKLNINFKFLKKFQLILYIKLQFCGVLKIQALCIIMKMCNSLICSIFLKTFFISQGRLEINTIFSIINFNQLVLFLHLATLSRNFNIFTIARNISKILQTMIPKSIIINVK